MGLGVQEVAAAQMVVALGVAGLDARRPDREPDGGPGRAAPSSRALPSNASNRPRTLLTSAARAVKPMRERAVSRT